MTATRRLYGLLGLLSMLGLAAAFWPGAQTLWQWSLGVLLGLSGYDAWNLLRGDAVSVERRLPDSLPVGVWQEVHLRFENRGRHERRLAWFDHYPQGFEFRGLPGELVVPAHGWVEGRYRIRPTQRGEAGFGRVQIRRCSPLGLWQRSRRLGEAATVKVFPDFAATSGYALLAVENRLGLMGVRRLQRRGEGTNFHQMREYRQGDSPRQVDWKASARMRKLVSREFQDERNQQVLFLLDSGRRMRSKDGELSHFDHCLNAVLLLAYVALRQGDTVGIATFGAEPRWVPPVKGPGGLSRILGGLYDLQPGLDAPDYSAAARALLARQRKRALVVLISNLRDEDRDDLLPALGALRRHHLVLLANLREVALEQALDQPVENLDQAVLVAATGHYLREREQALAGLARQNLLYLDETPDRLALALVNRYLDLKAAGKL
ncbi:MAG: DUF58 domain-containing protein [Chromatiales bacterium]|nr:DUF58 domain-containing protein [Chromatiales bacterium]